MPFVKCRFYTESGEPVRGGCRRKGTNCDFIHPDHPDWNNARTPKPRDSGDSGGSKSWGERSYHNAPATPATSSWDTGGGWGSGSGWGSASGWGAEDTNTTPKPVTESAWSTTKSRDTPSSASAWGNADASTTSSGPATSTESVWGGSSDNATGSGWGGTGDGASGWGNAKDADKDVGSAKTTGNGWGGGSGSGWGSTGDGTSGWGNAKDAGNDVGSAKTTGNGWGGSSDKATGSGWGSTGDGTSRTSGWGNAKDADKNVGSAKPTENRRGGSSDKATGSGWGNAKDADTDVGSGWGSTQNNGWGGGWGNADKDAGSAWGAASKDGWGASGNKDTSDAMIVDKSAEKDTMQMAKRRAVPPPPRIRIPDKENRESNTTGTNNQPLTTNRWGGSRTSNHTTAAPAPATISTPITAVTPTDSTRIKRKRDAAVLDDKADVFKEYIKSWERGVRARFLLAEAEAKRDRWFRTQKSACYARIGEAGRKKLDGQRAECDREVTAQREKLSAAITSLVEFHDTFSSNLELGQRYNVDEEAQKFVQESRGFVGEARALLVAQVLKDKNDAKLDDRQKQSSEDNSSSIDTLRSQFRDLEERLDQAQAELTLRRPRNIRSEIDELLTAKIANLRVARQREIDHAASQPRPEIVIPPAALTKIEETAQHVRELDAKVPQTVEDIRVLLLRVDATTRRVKDLEEELSTSKEAYKKMQRMVAEKEAVDRQADERLGKIQDQFEQLVASRPPGVTPEQALSPTNPNSRDKLMESLRPAFEAALDKFYEREVRPTMQSMERNVVDASDRLQAEAIQVLWGRIKPAMNMVADVSRWLDSQELEHTAPAPVEEVRASDRSP